MKTSIAEKIEMLILLGICGLVALVTFVCIMVALGTKN